MKNATLCDVFCEVPWISLCQYWTCMLNWLQLIILWSKWKKKNANARVSFTRTLLVQWIKFLSPAAQDDKDEKGLKLEKIGQHFQVWMNTTYIPKISQISKWQTSSDIFVKVNIIYRECCCLLIKCWVLFSTSHDLKTAKLLWKNLFKHK